MPEFIFDDPADQEWFEERAAILEFDALMARPRAETKAYLLTWQRIAERTIGNENTAE